MDAARFHYELGQLDKAADRLEGVESRGAEALRAEIRTAWEARAELDERLRTFRATLARQPRAELIRDLRQLLDETDDPLSIAAIKRELSHTEDWVANRDQDGFHKKAWLPGLGMRKPTAKEVYEPPTTSYVTEGPTTFDPLLTQVLEEVHQATEDKAWRRALASIDMAMEDTPAATTHLLARRADVLARAVADGRKLLAQAAATERARGLDAAHIQLLSELWRFPAEGPAGLVATRAAELEREIDAFEGPAVATSEARPEEDEEAAVSPPTPVEVARDEDADELAVRAGRAAAVGRFDDAAQLYRTASDRAWGASVETYARHARNTDARHALRTAIVARFGVDAASFADAGFDAVDVNGVTRADTVLPWSALNCAHWTALAGLVRDDEGTRLGLVLELFEADELEGRDGAYARLQRLQARGELDGRSVAALVARARGEEVPAAGYVWHEGRFITAVQHDEIVIGAEVKRLARLLETRSGEQRDAAYSALFELSLEHPFADAALTKSLTKAFDKEVQDLTRSGTLRKLSNMAAARRDLDERRSFALELIFNETEYFYPYKPPAVSSERASQYAAVQRDVDERVGGVRALWESPLLVKIPSSFREDLVDLVWTLERAEGFVEDIALPENLPAWLLAIDPELDELTLSTFAWDESERAAIDRDRAIRELNKRLWEEHGTSTAEKNQVRISNNYRGMLGRHALAWNPKIQEAATMHSMYMADSGHFGHYEEGDAKRRSPFDRMRLAGYRAPSGENCHMGSAGPEGAHNGWVHSSGHHRTLLSTQHTEMASSLVSYYWTQNFGRGTEFNSELEQK